MILHCSEAEMAQLREFIATSEDCELLSDTEAVLDLYELAAPMTLDIVFQKDGLRLDGAYYLAYSEELNGWYMERPIKNPSEVRNAFESSEIWKTQP